MAALDRAAVALLYLGISGTQPQNTDVQVALDHLVGDDNQKKQSLQRTFTPPLLGFPPAVLTAA